MKSHPDLGERILAKIHNERIGVAISATKCHHEKYDGSGYPEGLAGEEIPLVARIISVADAYDAMTSNRRYRNNFDDEKVIEEFEHCIESHFDKIVVEAFMALHARGEIVPLLSISEDFYRKFD